MNGWVIFAAAVIVVVPVAVLTYSALKVASDADDDFEASDDWDDFWYWEDGNRS